jgi:protein-cysteine N-palmitoyltransferase HHAT
MLTQQDNSDGQYANFRENVPYLALLVIIHPLVRRLYDIFFLSHLYAPSNPSRKGGLTQGLSPMQAANARLEERISFDLYMGLVYITALHGFSALKVLGILYINYRIGKDAPKGWVIGLTWTFNVGILFANEFGYGYPYAKIGYLLSPGFGDSSVLVSAGKLLDSYGGLIPRWHVFFKVTILRLISFNMDRLWSFDRSHSGNVVEVCFFGSKSISKLITKRRSRLIRSISRRGTECKRLQRTRITISRITWLTHCMRLCTSPGPS